MDEMERKIEKGRKRERERDREREREKGERHICNHEEYYTTSAARILSLSRPSLCSCFCVVVITSQIVIEDKTSREAQSALSDYLEFF